jgi:hypothetical protein
MRIRQFKSGLCNSKFFARNGFAISATLGGTWHSNQANG